MNTRGGCKYGSECRYLHKGVEECTHFKRGICRFGKGCRKMHIKDTNKYIRGKKYQGDGYNNERIYYTGGNPRGIIHQGKPQYKREETSFLEGLMDLLAERLRP